MKQSHAPPIRCLPLILVSMCVTTVILTYLGSHPPVNSLILSITSDEHPGLFALNNFGNVLPPDNVLDVLTKDNLQELLEGYFESRQMPCEQLLPLEKTELGTFNYLCKEIAEKNFDANNCIVYRFGQRNEAFEKGILDNYGCDIFSFESRLQFGEGTDMKVKRYPISLGEANLSDGVQVMSFDAVRSSLQHKQQQLSLIAMSNPLDEGWRILEDIVQPETLKGVKHLFIDLYTNCSGEKCSDTETKAALLNRVNSLKILYGLGFRIYHSIRFSDVQSSTGDIRDKTWYRLFLYDINQSHPTHNT